MSSLAAARADLRAARRQTVRALAGLSQTQLERPAPWLGGEANVRHLLLRLADDDAMRLIRLQQALAAAGHVSTEPRCILAAGCGLRGRLLGSVIGVPAELFHQGWGDGEWSVARTLGHVALTDKRYLVNTWHSVERGRAGGAGPMRPPPEAFPPGDGEIEAEGSIEEVLARLLDARDTVLARFASLSDADLTSETTWITWTLDVRFRLHRFAEHDREHLMQLRKTYTAIGFIPTETHRILEEAAAVRGALEGLLVGVQEGGPAAKAALLVLHEAAAAERETVPVILAAAG